MSHLVKRISEWKTNHPGALPNWVKRFARSWFRVTAQWRAHPDFVIIGTPKAGTTSFFSYLSQHEQILTLQKEVGYLHDPLFESNEGYRAFFPRASTLKKHGQLTGEATTTYFYDATVHARLRSLQSMPRLFLLLRDPTARAISHFYHSQRYNPDSRSIEEVFEHLLARYEGWQLGDSPPDVDSKITETDFLSYSLYAQYLSTWGSELQKDNLRIIAFEQLVTDPAAVVKDALDFLKLPPVNLPWRVFNRGDSRQENAELNVRLNEFFAPHNRMVIDLLTKTSKVSRVQMQWAAAT